MNLLMKKLTITLFAKNCIFTTKSDRNLNILLKAWHNIFLLNKDANLLIIRLITSLMIC